MVNKQDQEQYDVIIIGSGETGRDAIADLDAQGKKALLIELDADTIATMVHQSHTNGPSSSSSSYTYQQTNADTDPTYISVQENMLKTPTSQTVTYTFHITPSTEEQSAGIEIDPTANIVDEKREEPAIQLNKEQNELENLFKGLMRAKITETPVEEEPEPKFEEELEVIEPELVEAAEDTVDLFEDTLSINPLLHWSTKKRRYPPTPNGIQPSETEDFLDDKDEEGHIYNPERETPLRDKLFRRKIVTQSEQDYSDDQSYDNVEQNHDPFESINEEQQITSKYASPILPSKSAQSVASAELEKDPDSFLHTLLGEPLQTERESRLRKRFMKQRLETNHSITPSSEPSNEESNEHTNPQRIVQTEHEKKEKAPIFTTSDSDQENQADPISTNTELLHTGSASGRRRTRTKKKKRMLNKTDTFFETKTRKSRHKPFTLPPMALTETIEPEENLYNFDSSTIQPFKQTSYDDHPVVEQNEITFENNDFFMDDDYDDQTSSTSQNNESLKRDTIEFEEPYGYNSWEEFVSPYPNGNRKRPEVDQVEKRKIALRGLHNLINNLG